jgi:hypothetical protein
MTKEQNKRFFLFEIMNSFSDKELKLVNRYIGYYNSVKQQDVILLINNTTTFLYSLIACLNVKRNIYIINPNESRDYIWGIITKHLKDKVVITDSPSWYKDIIQSEFCPIKMITLSPDADPYECLSLENIAIVHTFDPNSKPFIFNTLSLDDIYFGIKDSFAKHKIFVDKDFWVWTKNPHDYFMYYFVLKELRSDREIDMKPSLPATDKSTIFLEYQLLLNIWDSIMSDFLQNKLFFKWIFKKYIGEIILKILRWKLKRHFKRYSHIVILGIVKDTLLAEMLMKWKDKKVFNIYGESNNLMFLNISDKPGTVDLTSIDDYLFNLHDKIQTEKGTVGRLASRDWNNPLSTVISSIYFLLESNKERYATYYGYKFKNLPIFPHKVESLMDIIPFIKTSLFVQYMNRNILLYDPDMDMLDRSNYTLKQLEGCAEYEGILPKYIKHLNSKILSKNEQITEFRNIPKLINKYNRFGELNKQAAYAVELL